MKPKFYFVYIAIFLLISVPWTSGRGGGGRGGRSRGRSSHVYLQRSNYNYKPNHGNDPKAFEWSKVGRIIGRLFGVSDTRPIAKPIAKGYQGSYKPKNVYHPKKPAPVVRADRIYEEDGKQRIMTPSSIKLI